MMQDLDSDLRDGMGYRGDGVLISGITPDSPADKAGLEKGDVLISVNGRSINSSGELSEVIGGMRAGQSASLVVMRDGARRTLNARLGSRPDTIGFGDSSPGWTRDLKGLRELRDLGDLKEKRGRGDLRRFDVETLPDPTGSGDHMFFMRGLGMGRGRLGVRVEDLSADLAPYFDSAEGSGALVMEVMKDTPAEKAGLKAGDVITRVGDDKISNADDLVRALHSVPEGKVSVTATRKGASRTFETELDDAPLGWKMQVGDMSLGPRRFVLRDSPGERKTPAPPGAQRDELRELRQQLRELQEKLDRLDPN
jgi:membrane-associated protease RseP (regulator of RpoE activity)